MKKLSLYKNNESVTFSRRLIVFLFDYIFMLFITMFIFLAVDSILLNSNTSKLNQIQTDTYNTQQQIINIMEESSLGYREDNSINDSSVLSDKFIHTLVYVSLNEIVEKKEAYDKKILRVNPIGYYYGEYKISHKDNYQNYLEECIGYDFINNLLLDKVNKNEEILYINGNDVLLHEGYAKALDNLISLGKDNITIDSETVSGTDTYSIIYQSYNELLQDAKEDLIINNDLYLKSFEIFNDVRNSMIEYKWLELVIIYSILSMVYFLVIPMLNKKSSTLSMLIFGMATCTSDGYRVSKLSIIIKYLSEFFMYFNVMCVMVIFLYNTNSQLFLQHNLFGFINMTHVYILSVLYLFVSFICTSLKSANHQTIGDKMSRQYVKDARY